MSAAGGNSTVELESRWGDEAIYFEPPAKLVTSEWADRYRILPPQSPRPGPWRTDFTPYLREPMDAFANPRVESIVLMWATQLGKTELILNCLAYAIDQRPGNILFVLPTQEDAEEMLTDRIRPMIEECGQLAQYLTGRSWDLKKRRMNFAHVTLFTAWAGAPRTMASKPLPYVFADELGKFPARSGDEADPVGLMEERTKNFPFMRKHLKTSSPKNTGDLITREFNKSDKREFYVPCPRCGEYQVLEFSPKTVRWPEGSTAAQVKANRLALYHCIACEKAITDAQKPAMLRAGVWVPAGCEIDREGEITGEPPEDIFRGYHLCSLYSPMITWSDFASKFLDSSGDVESLKNFKNGWEGVPWEEKSATVSQDVIELRALSYERGTVPPAVKVITATADVQKSVMYYTVRGWGNQNGPEESWLIEEGMVEDFDSLARVLFRSSWANAETGEPMSVGRALIDCRYRTEEVYDFCIQWAEIAMPVMAWEQSKLKVPWRKQPLDRDLQGKRMVRAIERIDFDTLIFKDKTHRHVNNDPLGVGAWHTYRNPSREYLEQMASEERIIQLDAKGKPAPIWLQKTSGRANHFWDCEVYQMVLGFVLGVRGLDGPPEPLPGGHAPREVGGDGGGDDRGDGDEGYVHPGRSGATRDDDDDHEGFLDGIDDGFLDRRGGGW